MQAKSYIYVPMGIVNTFSSTIRIELFLPKLYTRGVQKCHQSELSFVTIQKPSPHINSFICNPICFTVKILFCARTNSCSNTFHLKSYAFNFKEIKSLGYVYVKRCWIPFMIFLLLSNYKGYSTLGSHSMIDPAKTQDIIALIRMVKNTFGKDQIGTIAINRNFIVSCCPNLYNFM